MTSVGSNIRHYRQLHHLSQNDLANELHISRQTISKWERGVSQPTIEYLLGLSEFFQITIDELIKAEPELIKEEETLMKKAVFLVSSYTASGDSQWGKEAKDYGTRNFLANLSQMYPMYEWRAAKPSELAAILTEEKIGMIMLAPTVTPKIKEVEAQYPGKMKIIAPGEYAKISMNFILER